MKLLKVKNGLLEAENFFLASSFSDFAGSEIVSRDISTGKLRINSNNKIERSFKYNEFVIELRKENFSSMGVDDYSSIYLSNGNATFGIKDDDLNDQSQYWKILKQDNYIQAYSSNDGVNYTNIGGISLADGVTKQGFIKYGSEPFILDSYNVYDNPYLTIQNLRENTLCELYDSNNNLLKSRPFNSDMECKLFLDSNNLNGYLIFKDPSGSVLFASDNLTFGYGDVWVASPYNFEISYLGTVVTNVNPASLKDLSEMLTIKNISDVAYTGITIGTETNSNDLIQLSTDGITFTSTLILDFELMEEKQIYVQIIKNVDNHNFNVRDFQLIIK